MTVRRAANEPLGLMLMPQGRNRQVVVQGVHADSVAASWNAMTSCESRDFRNGDIIIKVNGCFSFEAILHEFQNYTRAAI